MEGLFGVLSSSPSGIPSSLLSRLGDPFSLEPELTHSWVEVVTDKGDCLVLRPEGPWQQSSILAPDQIRGLLAYVGPDSTTHLVDQNGFYLGFLGSIWNGGELRGWLPRKEKITPAKLLAGGIQFHFMLSSSVETALKRALKSVQGRFRFWFWSRQENSLYLFGTEKFPIFYQRDSFLWAFSSMKSLDRMSILDSEVLYCLNLTTLSLNAVYYRKES